MHAWRLKLLGRCMQRGVESPKSNSIRALKFAPYSLKWVTWDDLLIFLYFTLYCRPHSSVPLVSFMGRKKWWIWRRMIGSYIYGFRRKKWESLIYRGLNRGSVGDFFFFEISKWDKGSSRVLVGVALRQPMCGFLPRPIYSCCFVPIVGVLDLSILMQPSLSCVYV
jgi:hypothetical protein